MPTLEIPQDVLEQAGMNEHDALVELACHLFDTGKLTLFFAAKLAGLERIELESALLARGIPIYRYTEKDLESDLASLRQMGV